VVSCPLALLGGAFYAVLVQRLAIDAPRLPPSWKSSPYAMLSKKPHYVHKTVDYEALMVGRNALRWLQMLAKHVFVQAPV
jgi:hypothetical protein